MHKRIRWTSLALFSLALAGAGAASAETKDQAGKKGTTAKTSAACPSDDKAKLESVMKFLHTSHQHEIKHAKLAVDRAQSADVKSFADRMVKEHEDGDKKLTDLAMKKGIDLSPMQAPADPIHAALMGTDGKMDQSLQAKKGAAFDAAFMGPEVLEHTLVIAVIEEGQKVAKDEDVKRLLSEQHQAVTQHKEHASTILDKMKPTATAVGGGPGSEPDKSKTDKSKTDKTKTDKTKSDKTVPKEDTPKQGAPDWINPDVTPEMNK